MQIVDKQRKTRYNIVVKELMAMQNVTTEKALKNQLASVRMEGYRFSEKEIENVRKCLSGELSFKQFTDKIIKDSKRK
ncbi:antitoxin VbhA family protein [Ruminococcus flavefaciens]|uniref:antitoxin VbhA family protein n=1 Tax=Ruminococcus flavefaciens TaxID=1265 RepID=UPI0018AD35AD|nr:antitoxin VbhA family protein [Ruminococcus flavefaciens]